MNIKTLFALFSLLSFLGFISCSDELNTIGGSVQPPSDLITTATDTISLNAKTVSMYDSVYARTTKGVLGQYEDNLFGTIKSDYLCQFYFPEDAKFSDTFVKLDSVLFVIDFINYQGDSLAPMGLTVYPVDRPLVEDFYTNADPTKYSDVKNPLTSRAYTIAGSEVISTSTKQRQISSDLGLPFGQAIYDAWKDGTIKDDKTFNDFFPGVYVTTTSGSGSLLNVLYTSIDMYYTKTYVDTANVTRDTTAYFSLSVTPEIIQLNHITNKNPEELFVEETNATYLKTPAGVYTEVVLPVGQIAQNMEKSDMSTVNSAIFTLKGYTEKEDDSDFSLGRPTSLLLIPKDSIDSFFKGRKLPDGKLYYTGSRTSSNIYSFGNISSLITAYKDKNIDEVTCVVLPVSMEYSYNASTGASQLVGVYNYMVPSTAILRSDPENMRVELVYSKF